MDKKCTQKEIAHQISEQVNLPQEEVIKIMELYFEKTLDYLCQEKMQAIPHIGTFKLRWHESYNMYSPKLKKEITAKAKYGIRFHSALSLNKMINQKFKQNIKKNYSNLDFGDLEESNDLNEDEIIAKTNNEVENEIELVYSELRKKEHKENIKNKPLETIKETQTKEFVDEKMKTTDDLNNSTNEYKRNKKNNMKNLKKVNAILINFASFVLFVLLFSYTFQYMKTINSKKEFLSQEILYKMYTEAYTKTEKTNLADKNSEGKKEKKESLSVKQNQKINPSIDKLTTKRKNNRVVYIKQGDNLPDIAQQFYGDSDLWPYIYRENKETISDPLNLIPIKDVIILNWNTDGNLAELYQKLAIKFQNKKKFSQLLKEKSKELTAKLEN